MHKSFFVFSLCLGASLFLYSCSNGKREGQNGASQQHTPMNSSTKSNKVKPVANEKSYTGFLEIDPIRYGKGMQTVTVHTSSGKSIGIAIRYRKEHMQFINKRVNITGAMAQTSSDPRAQSASYFRVTSLTLAPGEKSYAAIPKELPHPPLVYTEKEIKKLPGGWGVAVGKTEFFPDLKIEKKKLPHRIITKVILTLKDGFKITKYLHHMVSRDSDAYTNGTTGTLLFRYTPKWDKKISPYRFCHGNYKWCGMKQQPYKRPIKLWIKGRYNVLEGKRRVGFLYLYENNYEYIPESEKPSKSMILRFPFFKKRKGSTKITYEKGITLSLEVEKLQKNQIVATINFTKKSSFYIRMSSDAKAFNFHSKVSEFQTWSITKSLSNEKPKKKNRKRKF
jgi:hypothetical protein